MRIKTLIPWEATYRVKKKIIIAWTMLIPLLLLLKNTPICVVIFPFIFMLKIFSKKV